MPKKGLYKGFSSHEFFSKKTFKVRDIEIVKLDLLNHIFTRTGSRVMMPTFGTQIPDMVFEQLDDETIEIITEELSAVFEFDPRVQTLNLVVLPDYDNNAVRVTARLLYLELDTVDDFELNIQFED